MRLIDADALMAEMKEYRSEQEKEQMYSGDRGICVTWNDAMFFIKNAPTIEPERKRGRKINQHQYPAKWICSECGVKHFNFDDNFCSNCGADVRIRAKC